MPRFTRPRLASGKLTAISGLVLSVLLAGCGGGGGNNNSAPSGTGALIPQPNNDSQSTLGHQDWTINTQTYALAQKPWTFLVYMNGANDLGSGAGNFDIQNILQMEKVGSTSNVNIVVQWEAARGSWDTSTPAWTGTRRYYITQNPNDSNANISSPMISQNSTVDMGDWQSLQDFVQWGVQAYPATHYCLIIWDHGAGWRAETLSVNSRAATKAVQGGTGRGVSFNYATGAYIDTTQIPEAIDISTTAAKKFDIVSFDASLMQMIEIAYQMTSPGSSASSGYTPPTYIQGSEESPPGAGLPYDTILANLATNPSQSGADLGKEICTATLTQYGNASDSTQSVLATAQLPALTTAINNLGTALTNAQSQWGSQISIARSRTEHYSQGEEAATEEWYADYRDLVDFTNQLTTTSSTGSAYVNNPGVISAAQAVRTAASAAIVYNANGSQHPNSHGLSIWIPSPSDFATTEQQQASGNGPGTILYTQLRFSQAAPAWLNFLQNGPN